MFINIFEQRLREVNRTDCYRSNSEVRARRELGCVNLGPRGTGENAEFWWTGIQRKDLG